MASIIGVHPSVQPPPPGVALIPSTASPGILTDLACKCSPDDSADFLVKKDRIVCAACAREVQCLPPVLGVVKATCACCIAPNKSTFVLDSSGNYVCTWCGVSR